MGDSREPSPDWLREFQAPSQTFVTLSSSSDSSPEVSPKRSDQTSQEPKRHHKEEDSIFIDSCEGTPVVKAKKPKTVKTEGSPVVKAKRPKTVKTEKNNSVKEDDLDAKEEEPAEEDIREKPVGPPVSSRLPLMFPEKVQRSKALVECDGDSIDLSGDVGAVGRIVISNGSAGKDEMLLDLKGTVYKTTIVPSRTFCIVSVGQSEAKIEAIMNDFVQLEPHSNVFEAETMIEGTLDGFSFDSDEEGNKVPKSSTHQTDQNNENEDKANTKTKGKVEKSSGAAQKKAKTAAKPPKKGARKPQAVKRTRKLKK